MTDTFHGTQTPFTLGAEYNAQYAIIKSILSRIHTSLPCKVVNVTNNGGVDPVGYVDIEPLVNQLTANGTPYKAGIIYHVPYFRLQGGKNAIIIDPEINDIGDALFAERDISNVIINKAVSNPGSARRFDISDAIFLCGTLNEAPTQYIQFTSTGITIHSPHNVAVYAGGNLTATVAGNMDAEITGSAKIAANTITLNGGGTVKGIVQGDCLCAFTGAPHPQVSGTVTGTP